MAARTLRHAPDGDPTVDIEVDPRYALDAEELGLRIPTGLRVDGPIVLDADRGNGGRTQQAAPVHSHPLGPR